MANNDISKVLELKTKMFLMPFYSDELLKKQVYWQVVKTIDLIQKTGNTLHVEGLVRELILFPKNTDLQLTGAFVWAVSKAKLKPDLLFDFLQWISFELIEDSSLIEKLGVLIAKSLLGYQSTETQKSGLFETWVLKKVEQFPDLPFLKYYAVKLLLKNNNMEEARLKAFELVKLKPNEFWVFHILGACFEGQPRLQISAYCKALTIKNKPEMHLGVRQDFAELLVKYGKWNFAKSEIEEIIRIRNTKGWKITPEVAGWYNMLEIKNTNAERLQYARYIEDIEDKVFGTYSQAAVVITKIDKILGFGYYIAENKKGGKFSLSILNELQLGVCYTAYFVKHPVADYDILKRLVKLSEVPKWVRSFEGTLNIKEAGFGFVNDIYVSGKFISNNNLQQGDYLNGSAIESFDLKRNKNGWMAHVLKKTNS